MTNDEKYADRIAKLLRKAESTTPEEAEALMAKAAELMTMYAIDEQMIAKAGGREIADELTNIEIEFTGIYRQVQMHLAFTVMRHFDCRGFYSNRDYNKPKKIVVSAYGYKSDLARVELLHASLQVQMTRAMMAWSKASASGGWDGFRGRRAFISGFVSGVGSKLAEAKRAAMQVARDNEATRSGTSSEDAGNSVALVLRDRKKISDEWFDSMFGNSLRKGASRGYSSGPGNGHGAGYAAGRSSDIGQPRVGGAGRALPR